MSDQPINWGGYAFPMPSGPEPRIDCSTHYNEGMTLRDYFAAAALQGILANPNLYDTGDEEAACDSYKMADAMLKAREGK